MKETDLFCLLLTLIRFHQIFLYPIRSLPLIDGYIHWILPTIPFELFLAQNATIFFLKYAMQKIRLFSAVCGDAQQRFPSFVSSYPVHSVLHHNVVYTAQLLKLTVQFDLNLHLGSIPILSKLW